MLILVFLLLVWPSWTYAQMESSPGVGPINTPVRGSSNLNWSGLHNAQPEQALIDGTNIYPPSSSGIYTEVVGGASHVIRCPLSVATVDEMIFEITEGANVVSFDATCYGWIGNTPPTFTVNGYDEVVCHSRKPTISNVAPFTCNSLLNVGFRTSPVWITGALGTSTGGGGGTSSSVTLSASAGQSLLCQVNWVSAGGATVTSVSDGTSNLTAGDTVATGNNHGQLFYEINITGHSVSTLTVTYSGSVTFGQARCDVISGATILVVGGHAIAVQANIGGGTDAVTSGSVTSVLNALVWGAGTSTTGAVTLAAGTGFTLHGQDTSGANWNFTTESKISAGVTDQATFTNSSATNTINFTGVLVVQ